MYGSGFFVMIFALYISFIWTPISAFTPCSSNIKFASAKTGLKIQNVNVNHRKAVLYSVGGSSDSKDSGNLRAEAERLLLQAERLRLEGERQALELAKEKLIRERKKLEDATKSKESEIQISNLEVDNNSDGQNTTGQSIKSRFKQLDARRLQLRQKWSELMKSSKNEEQVEEVSRDIAQLASDVELLEEDVGIDTASSSTSTLKESLTLYDRLLKVSLDSGLSETRGKVFVKIFVDNMASAPDRNALPFRLFFSDYIPTELIMEELHKPISQEEAFWPVVTFETTLDMAEKDKNKRNSGQWEEARWAFSGTLANALFTRSKNGDEMLTNMKRLMAGEDGFKVVTDMTSSFDESGDISEFGRLKVFMTGWRSYIGTSSYLSAEEIDQLKNSVFTADLLSAEVDRRREAQKKLNRVGKIQYGRLSEGTAEMVSAVGLAAVSITGIEETGEVLNEVKRRIANGSLSDRLRLFVLRDVTQTIEERSFETEESGDEIMEALSRSRDMGEAMMLLAKESFDRKPRYVILAAPKLTLPSVPFGGKVVSYLLAAFYIVNTVLLWDESTISPLLLILAIQAVHELGHVGMAILKEMKPAYPPRVLPGSIFGALGSSLQLEDFAENSKDLFDYSVSGLIFGMIASFALLFFGLQATAAASAVSLGSFPKMPTYLLQSSFLVGGIVNTVLPNLAISAPDIAAPITALHPLAYAGVAGIFISALHCVPLGGTDGSVVLKSVVPEVPDSLRDVGIGLLLPVFQIIASACTAWQIWQSFFGDTSNEGLLSMFLPLIVIFAGRFETTVIDERPQVGPIRTLIAIALQFFWLATLLPMPLHNFLGDANDVITSLVGGSVSGFMN